MDLFKAIRELRNEKQRLDAIITSLEAMMAFDTSAKPQKQRGRKHMNAEERRKVAQRMREYWAKRRKQQGAAETDPNKQT